MKEKLKGILDEYGGIAIGTYLALFGLVLAGFFLAIVWGVEVSGAEGSVGTIGALFGAWAATKLTQPLRIGATFLLTPAIAAGLRRWRPQPQERAPEDQP